MSLLALHSAAADKVATGAEYVAEPELGDVADESSLHPIPQSAALSVDSSPSEKNKVSREGKSVWLEKKIAKPTRWLENLVKPMNIWLEGKIQAPVGSSDKSSEQSLPSDRYSTSDVSSAAKIERISANEAIVAALQNVDGDVLKVKLVTMPASLTTAAEDNPARMVYRVRLISKRGEIHILYIDALTSVLVDPTATLARAKPEQEQSEGAEHE